MQKIYIIAGEPSGDFLGANLIKALKILNPTIHFRGIGGNLMELEGIKSLINQRDLGIIGFYEVIKKIFLIKKNIQKTLLDIEEFNPDILITIDFPGFAKEIIKRTTISKKIHYVAPSVWAWKENRAKWWAKNIQHMLCLFDFEPKYFTKLGLDATFVGHPIMQKIKNKTSLKKDKVLIMPGSREQEIKNHLKIFINAFNLIKNNFQNLSPVIITLPHLYDLCKAICVELNMQEITICSNQKEHDYYFLAAKMAFLASGTATLELAIYKIPMVVGYKISQLSYIIIKNFIHTKYVALPNIILNKLVVPECLQNDFNAKNLSNKLLQLLEKKDIFYNECEMLIHKLEACGKNPSIIAAKKVLEYL